MRSRWTRTLAALAALNFACSCSGPRITSDGTGSGPALVRAGPFRFGFLFTMELSARVVVQPSGRRVPPDRVLVRFPETEFVNAVFHLEDASIRYRRTLFEEDLLRMSADDFARISQSATVSGSLDGGRRFSLTSADLRVLREFAREIGIPAAPDGRPGAGSETSDIDSGLRGSPVRATSPEPLSTEASAARWRRALAQNRSPSAPSGPRIV